MRVLKGIDTSKFFEKSMKKIEQLVIKYCDKMKIFFYAGWRGEASLFKAWVLYFFIGFIAYSYIAKILIDIAGVLLGSFSTAVYQSVTYPYIFCSILIVWRCAKNAKWRLWKYISRLFCIYILASLVLVTLIRIGYIDRSFVVTPEKIHEFKDQYKQQATTKNKLDLNGLLSSYINKKQNYVVPNVD